MKYIRKEIDLAFILSANDSIDLKWWIYASYAVHKNMRGHIGEGLYMGRGYTIVTLTNQKLNTLISIESDIVVVHNCMSAVCWTRYFMEAQGYQVMEKNIYQDNRTAILLKKNGKSSSRKLTKHINVCFFFVTDCISKK